MIVAEVILYLCLAYSLCGLAVAIPFVLRAVDRVDASARGASMGFRLLILPGTVPLWPRMTAKGFKARKAERHS